jgi:hypothetical protein
MYWKARSHIGLPPCIVAKELGDFLQHYKRETELFTVFREESGMIPRSFLKGQSTTGQIPGVCIFSVRK